MSPSQGSAVLGPLSSASFQQFLTFKVQLGLLFKLPLLTYTVDLLSAQLTD